MPSCTPSIASSQLQSEKKMLADLPPNSKVAGINLSAAALATASPISVEPVKASFARQGCSRI